MRRKKKLEPDNPERSARFIEIAEQIQNEDSEKRFEEAMTLISQARKIPPVEEVEQE